MIPVFLPLAGALKTGNFLQFQQTLAAHESYLFEKGLLIALTHRLRPLLWRSLSRRTFLITYTPPTDPSSNLAATLSLSHLETTAAYLQKRLEGWVPAKPTRGRPAHVTSVFLKAVTNSVVDDGTGSTLVPPPGGPKKLRPNEGLVCGNMAVTSEDVEMMVAALVQQGLLKGYIAHSSQRFAILGGKQKGGPAVAGWPNVWQAIRGRTYEEEADLDDVPGWVRS
jgi:nuclear mRNA export protein PCID2/THP1